MAAISAGADINVGENEIENENGNGNGERTGGTGVSTSGSSDGSSSTGGRTGVSTALHITSERQYVLCVELLCQLGARLDLKNENNETPLDIASRMNYLDVQQILRAASPSSSSPGPGSETVITNGNATRSI